ncbi:MAG: exodeoxyribonuclease VII large subunit [Castellaniella sp.]|uniref:exodeoxyribonuclease VII large subunit n=1 Tax=Castellaniella sp. TaxID=1955812 RepID=UPI002A367FD3|nr:exodeoxyribonuclease VII large subunit [Castellaniella sp.]MDY0309862.1 exodeoxyribonuclease VII large subunit [Castellaniella sp.]
MGFSVSRLAESGFPAGEAVLTVSQLNRRVAQLLEDGVPRLWVAGEVSNFTRAASGHWYFSIKDEAAAVRAVMFRGRAQGVGFVPEVGGRYEFRVQVSLYEPRGDYQVQVESLRPAGRGDLHEAFLRLRDRLTTEGLIDPARRRALPVLPRAVGVVTSLTAAALRDVLAVMARRAPHVRVIVYPAQVQGREAASQLCAALDRAVARAEVDTLLLVRGGGSLEDLWCFNDETLARSIAACPIPVISGVGHETDFTIADFVADLRAPTPTAAAELCCEDRAQVLGRVRAARDLLIRSQQRRLEHAAIRLDRARAQLVSPAQRLQLRRQRLEFAARRLQSGLDRLLQERRQRPAVALGRLSAGLDGLLQRHHRRLDAVMAALGALDPHRVLGRGYALVRRADGTIVKNALDLKVHEPIEIEFDQGRAQAEVTRADFL